MPAKKKSKAASGGMNKTEFVRSFPPSTPADALVVKGKTQGLELSKKFIWTKQSEMRRESRLARVPATPGKPARGRRARKGVAGKRSADDAARQMRALIVELGTARADELYRSVRAQLLAIAQG